MDEVARVLVFLREIGIPCEIEHGARGFAEGVRIDAGALLVDPACSLSTLLHEAGHLAIVPGRYRGWMSGNLYAGMRRMLQDVQANGAEPDSLLWRAVVQCSDPEATAWAWAAGRHLGIQPEIIIADEDYDNCGDSVRLGLKTGHYLGINGLQHAGFCIVRANAYRPEQAVFPRLNFWTQVA